MTSKPVDEILLAKRVGQRISKKVEAMFDAFAAEAIEDANTRTAQIQSLEQRLHELERAFARFKEVERLEITRAAVAKVLKSKE